MSKSSSRTGSRDGRGWPLALAALTATLAMLAVTGGVRGQPNRVVRTDLEADRFEYRQVDGERVTYMIGNVRIARDTLTVEADSAISYDSTDEFDVFGHVRMTRGRAVVTCREAYYNDRSRDADFVGDVRVVDGEIIGTGLRAEMRNHGDLMVLIGDARLVAPDYVVHADSILSREDSGRGEAFGNVIMVDPDGESIVRGEHADFDRGGGRVTVDIAPRLESRQQGGEPLLAEARFMDFFEQEDRVVMIDSVRIRQGRSLALADTAHIYGREHMVLTGAPSMDDGQGTVMLAEVMKYWYLDGELDRVRLEGVARMEDDQPAELAEQYPGLPAMNVLSGDTLIVQMEEGNPDRSMVMGNGQSIYVPADAEKEVAYNDVQGDTIVIAFEDRRVDQVDVRGNMKGSYAFIRLENLASLTSGAESVLDSLLHADRDSLRVLLPDSLRAELPEDLASWRHLPPKTAEALAEAVRRNLTAAQDSTLEEVLERGLASVTADTLDDGGTTVDFTSNRELVDYSGHRGIFQLGERQIAIRGDGALLYGSMDLKAGDIRLDTINRELYAAESPLLIDGSQKMAGRDMAYDFGNRSGAVRQGATTMDGYYYVGKHIKRFGDGELKIRGGKMTSCDLAKPHYHFWADKMKIQLDDKVVAKPIVMKIGEVPVFALPFFFKSLKSGRRSGIIFPTFDFGWSGRTGRYIRNWGYYWATNDYTDFTFRGDYNEHRELTWQISNQYTKRYDFNGNFLYSRRTTLSGDPQTKEWQLRWSHTQNELFDYYRFKADLKMSSQEISREDLISDVGQQVVNSQQTSNVFISRSWTNMSGSLSFKRDEYVNAGDDDDLTNNRLSVQNFPGLSLSFKSTALKSPLRGGQKGNFFSNMLRNTYLRHSYTASSTTTDYESTQHKYHKLAGNLSLDVKPPRILLFNVSTGVSSGLNWSRDETTGSLWQIADGDTVYASAAETVEESSKSLAVNSSLSTTLYGVFGPRLGSLRGVRHTMRFTASHTWRPEIGGTQTADQRFSFRLSNRFDLKFKDEEAGADSTESFRKLDGVLDWSLSSSYDPDLGTDSRWSTIQSNMVIKPGKSRNAKVTMNSSIDPYELRVTNTRLTYGLNLSGRFDTGGTVVAHEPERNEAIGLLVSAEDDSTTAPVVIEEPWEDEVEGVQEDDFTGFGIFADESSGSGRDETEGGRFLPWRAGSSFSYSRNHLTDDATARISLNASATLSPTWKLSWRAGYDLEAGELTTQSWNLEKDLHCWSLRFNRTISVVDSQFGFVIALKAIPDIKVTKGREDLVGGGLSGLSRSMY